MSDDPNNRRHPNSTFQATYPYNQATVSRSGHEFHINDTPGNESLRLAHTKGSYVEIESTGRWVQVVTEKAYSYIKGSLAETVDSHVDRKVGGTYTFNVDTSSFEAVGTDKTVGVGGDLVDGVGGVRQQHTEKDKYESVNGSSVLGIKGDSQLQVDGSCVSSIKGPRADILGDDWSVTGKNVEHSIEGRFRVSCEEFVVDARDSATINAKTVAINATDSVTIITSGGPITVTASGTVYINGEQIRLNDS